MTSTARYLHETHASGPPRAGHIGSAWRWGPSETPSGHPPAPTRRRARSWFGIRYRADPRAGKCRPPARLIEVESSVPSSRCFWARFSSPRGPRKSHSAPRPEACRHGGRPRGRVDRAHPGCETGAERVTVRLSQLGVLRERLAFQSARPRCLTSNTLDFPPRPRASSSAEEGLPSVTRSSRSSTMSSKRCSLRRCSAVKRTRSFSSITPEGPGVALRRADEGEIEGVGRQTSRACRLERETLA